MGHAGPAGIKKLLSSSAVFGMSRIIRDQNHASPAFKTGKKFKNKIHRHENRANVPLEVILSDVFGKMKT